MMARCYVKSATGYKNYGGKGIRVCKRWRKFENFLADMGERPSETHSIDRFPDQSGDYEPGNCRWATDEEQANNMSTNRVIEHDGKRKTISKWAKELGMTAGAIVNRLARGWSIEKALKTPRTRRRQV